LKYIQQQLADYYKKHLAEIEKFDPDSIKTQLLRLEVNLFNDAKPYAQGRFYKFVKEKNQLE
jgi:hypothetical protein